MNLLKRGSLSLLLLLIIFPSFLRAQESPQESASLESVINRYVLTYGLSASNKFKLAAYTELKGRYDHESKAVVLDFGSLGYLSFYERNCLLRLPGNKIYSLDHYETGTPNAFEMDAQLHDMFERITMMSDGDADSAKIEFIDRNLAKKNLEPFDKLFIRHVLVHFGEFDPMLQEVVFESKDMPAEAASMKREGGRVVKQPIVALKMKLDASILRGWYLNSGGTVFVENADRNVRFATGEEYDHNVAAFKIFGQKLFVQSVQFIAQYESSRLAKLQEVAPTMNKMVTMDSEIENSHTFASNEERRQAMYERNWRRTQGMAAQPLYTQYSWIPMMLNMLRNENVNIGDEDVICYFVHIDAFNVIYGQLLPLEKEKVNGYLEAEGINPPSSGWASAR